MIRKYNLTKEDSFILIAAIMMISINIGLQYFFGDLNQDFWMSLIPNFIADTINIVLTAYVITYLLRKGEEKRAKDKVNKMLGKRYNNMIQAICINYIHFTTKPVEHLDVSEQHLLSARKNIAVLKRELQEVIDDIDRFINKDFIIHSSNVRVKHSTGPSMYKYFDEFWDHYQFAYFFKSLAKNDLDKFTSKYISVLPDDLKENLFSLEDMFLDESVFLTPIEHGTGMQEISPTSKDNLEHHKEVLKEMGIILMFLISYFEEVSN